MIVQRNLHNFNPLSPNLFKHSTDEDKGRDHQGQDVLILYDKFSLLVQKKCMENSKENMKFYIRA